VAQLIADMAEGERESLTLAALRDTLLTMLISGELRTTSSGAFAEEMTL